MSGASQRALAGFLATQIVLFVVLRAAAFCQATTCDPATQHCKLNAAGCLAMGFPLAWVSNCITVSVQAAGAPKQHIDYATAQASVTRAFAAWSSARCSDGGMPSLSVIVNGPIACDASEYNSDRGNANIVVFREDSWPYVGGEDALGLTRIRFDPATGEIWDSDIEVNAVDEPLSAVEPGANSVDLDSLLTHEAGHLLGLAHNALDVTATMYPGYQRGGIGLRSPAADDISGICSLYPPTRQARSSSCEPRHGFSDLCGAEQPATDHEIKAPPASACAFSPDRSSRSGWHTGMVAGLGALASSRRRARRGLQKKPNLKVFRASEP